MSILEFQEQLMDLVVKYYQDYNIYDNSEYYHKCQALLEAGDNFFTKDQERELKEKLSKIHPMPETPTEAPESTKLNIWYDISTLRKMNAKYAGKCVETGKGIEVGEVCLFETSNRKVYCKDSETYRNWKSKKKRF